MKKIINMDIETNKYFKEKLNEITIFHNEFSNKLKNQFSSCYENYYFNKRSNIDTVISKPNDIT